jgi:hypothetical protein
MTIIDYHRAVFDFLETYRREHPEANLTYLLRQNNKVGRPRNVYLFSGSDKYVSIGLYLPASSNSKTRTIAFCIDYNAATATIKSSRLILVFDDANLADQQPVYEKIIQKIGLNQFVEFRSKRYELIYKDHGWKNNLLTYLTQHKPIIDEVIRQAGAFETFHVPEKNLEDAIEIANQPVIQEQLVSDVNYWVFQGNPAQFQILKSLENGALKTWRVAAHAERIKPGDMVILWVTGAQAGCYALLKITSDVYIGPDEPGEQQYQLTGFAGGSTQQVKIEILLNLWNQPVMKEELQNLPAFPGFKGGNQGTNFTATREQFEAIERLSEFGKIQGSRRYWKYSPGRQAVHWEDDFREKIMTIDFSNYDTGPLDQYTDQADLDAHLGKVGNASNETWNMTLFKEAAIGDVIFANRGRNFVVGIGIISGPYQYRDTTPYNRHYRSVNWLTDKLWQYTPNLFSGKENLFRIDTFSPTLAGPQIIQAYLDQYPEYRPAFEQYGLLKLTASKILLMPNPEDKHPKNIILYGPPGTGKTYGTIDLAVEIIDGQTNTEHPVNKGRFDQLRKEGQIEFVTFHQNYTYEDFVMGIKPDLDATSDSLKFKQYEGVFYRMAKLARQNFEASQSITEGITLRPFEDVFTEFIRQLEEGDVEIEVKMASGISFYLIDVSERSIDFRKASGGTDHTISIATLKRIYEGGDYHTGLRSYYQPIIQRLMTLGQKAAQEHPETLNYVLIIDEINRANMSRVFGELITLLEEDKRLGEENELTVTLPSGEAFSVPPNLYLIGTMNTADKSLALLDIALRRRFEFIYKKPDASLLDPNVEPILNDLNRAIRGQHKSADFLIGHAYFIGKDLDQLPGIFNNRVIPLLMEYFNGNAKTVIGVLEKACVTAVQDDITDQITVSHVG